MLGHCCHVYDSICRETVFLLNLLQSALASLASLHTVQGYDETFDLHISLCTDDWESFLDGFSGSGHILNDHHTVAVFDRTSEQDSCISVVFDLLTVGTVADILSI